MKTSMPVDGFAGGLAASLGPAIQALSQSRGSSAMAGAQGALMGAQTAEAGEKARGLAMTNDFRANPNAFLEDPRIKSMVDANPDFGRYLVAATLLGLGSNQMSDIAGQASKFQSMGLTGEGVQKGSEGDISGQNRLISAANGKTYEPFKAVGDTGYAMDSATGTMLASSPALTALFGTKADKDNWSTPQQSSNGFFQASRGGDVRYLTGPDGKTLMPTTVDPLAQGSVAEARARGTAQGKGAVEAAMGAPKELAQVEQMISSVDNILSHPSLSSAVGWQAALPVIPGTGMADFVAASDQLEGQAFLQAFESLKGGGQITEIEGQKATQAIGRLSRSQSEEEYKRSLQELKGILMIARKRAQDKMSGGQPSMSPPDQIGAPATAPNRGAGRSFEYEGRRGIMYQDGSYEWVN